MKNKTAFVLIVLASVVGTFLLSGCSLIGFTVGAIVDGSKPDRDSIAGQQVIENIELGDSVEVVLVNGGLLEGVYIGVDTFSVTEYDQTYNEASSQIEDDIILPEVGDTVTLTINGYLSKAQFLGFGHKYVLAKRQGDRRISMIDLDNLTSITNTRGNSVKAKIVKNLLHDGRLPSALPALLIKDGQTTARIPIDSLKFISVETSKNSKWVGLGIGLAVDVVAVVIVTTAMGSLGRDFGDVFGDLFENLSGNLDKRIRE